MVFEQSKSVLIASSYPFSLIRRRMLAEPMEMEEVKKVLQEKGFSSAWGHANTIKIVNDMLGVDITPKEERPVIVLDSDNLPTLYGQKFTKIIVISPDYQPGFRPQIGEEVSADKILGWQALLLDFDV